jgi:hypothetical protein
LAESFEEVVHCLIVLHEHGKTAEDCPPLKLVVDLLIVETVVGREWRELIGGKVCRECD